MSDNIPGVPGVGDKTAAKLVNQFGSVEELVEHTDMLKGKQKEHVEASADRLGLNKDLARIDTDLELPVDIDDCVMGEWDTDEVRRLFTSLEFRSLFDWLQEIGNVKLKVDVAELDLREVSADELASIWAGGALVGVRLDADDDAVRGAAISAGGAQAAYALLEGVGPLEVFLADGGAPKWTMTPRARAGGAAPGGDIDGMAFDTMLAGYLLDPASADYSAARARRDVPRCRRAAVEGEETDEGQLFADTSWRTVAAEAAAIALLAPGDGGAHREAGAPARSTTWSSRSRRCWQRMEARGIQLDVDYLEEMGESVRDRMATLRPRSTRTPARSSTSTRHRSSARTPLRTARPSTWQAHPSELSTDASVLEKLRDAHPIVDALLSWRELDKLNSTYLEALPKLVDPRDGRVHTTFADTPPPPAACPRPTRTCRTCRSARSSAGRSAARSCPAPTTRCCSCSTTPRSSCASSRLSGDEGLRTAFESGEDIHTATAARVFGLPLDAVDPLSRSRAKMVNYGPRTA